jgi:hypothetical protein
MINVVAASHDRALDDRPAPASAPLKSGFDRDSLSRYGDLSWDLGPAVFRENARRCHVTAHFGSVEDPGIREALREFLYARLNADVPGHRKKLPPAQCAASLQSSAALLRVRSCRTRRGRSSAR